MGKRLRVLAIVAVVALLIVGGTVALAHHLRGDVATCAGVGLNGPAAASSRAALAAFLQTVNLSASNWKRVEHNTTSGPESDTYAPRNGKVQHVLLPQGLIRLYVTHRGRVWRVDSAC